MLWNGIQKKYPSHLFTNEKGGTTMKNYPQTFEEWEEYFNNIKLPELKKINRAYEVIAKQEAIKNMFSDYSMNNIFLNNIFYISSAQYKKRYEEFQRLINNHFDYGNLKSFEELQNSYLKNYSDNANDLQLLLKRLRKKFNKKEGTTL
jgi:hypothetical protein